MKKINPGWLILLAIVVGVLCFGFIGLKDAQAADKSVTFVSNFVTNVKSDKGIVALVCLGLATAASLIAPRIAKLINR